MSLDWQDIESKNCEKIKKIAQKVEELLKAQVEGIAHLVKEAVEAAERIVGDYPKVHGIIEAWIDAKAPISDASGDLHDMANKVGEYWTGPSATAYKNWLEDSAGYLEKFTTKVIGNTGSGVIGELQDLATDIETVVSSFVKTVVDCAAEMQKCFAALAGDTVKSSTAMSVSDDGLITVDVSKIGDATADELNRAAKALAKFEKEIVKSATKVAKTYDKAVDGVEGIQADVGDSQRIRHPFSYG